MRSVVDWHWLGFDCGCGGWSSVEGSWFWTFWRSWVSVTLFLDWLGFGCGCGGWSSVESSGFSFWTFRRSWGPCFDVKHTQNLVSATQQTLLVERQRCEISSRSCCLEILIFGLLDYPVEGPTRRRGPKLMESCVEGVVHLKVTGEVSKKHLRKENLEPFVLPKMALFLMWHVHWQAEQRSVFNSDSVLVLLRLCTIQCYIFELDV